MATGLEKYGIYQPKGGFSRADPFTLKKKKKKKKEAPVVKKSKKKVLPIVKKPKPKVTDKGRAIAIVEKEGKEYVLPKREAPEVAAVQAEERRQAGVALEAGEEAAPVLGEAGAFEEVTPKKTSLAARPMPGEDVPILGGEIAAVQNILFNAEAKGWIPDFSKRDPITGGEAFPMTPETLREAALRQISINSFDEGISLHESVGAFIESIPAVGGLIGKYVGGLVQAPYANAMHVIGQIEKVATTATNNQEKTRSGIMPAAFAMARAKQMEEEIAKLEGRLKILIQTSAILQANTDQVNKIEEAILDAKIRTDNFRTAAAFALTASLTGTGRIVPTDEQMYFELKEYNEK